MFLLELIAGNRLGDVGANHLWQVLNTLPNLMALNLSGNGLTELSLSNLATTLEGGTSLQVCSLHISADELCKSQFTCVNCIRKIIFLLAILSAL